MKPPFIPMTGVQIGAFHVLDRVYVDGATRAQFWVRHECGEQEIEGGTTLRRAQAGRWMLRCKRCESEAQPA